MSLSIRKVTFFTALYASLASLAVAAEAPYGDKTLGDVGGARSKLANAGLELEVNYTGDLWGVAHGGKKRITTYLDLLELRANIDNEKLLGIKGNSMSVAMINSNGATTNSSAVGSTQGIDNAEVVSNGVRLYEAWVQQNFMDDRLSVLLGLHDLNSEFAVTTISDNFIKPTMQIGQSFAQSGTNGPSVFPTTSLAGRVKIKPSETTYIAAAAYDGIPGDPDHTTGSAIKIEDKDALLLVAEIGYTPQVESSEDELNKLALGVWRYTSALPDQEDATLQRTPQGMYALGSYRFYHDQQGRAAGVFLRGGVADGDTAQVDWDYEAGLVGNGLIPSRPDSEIGFGISQAHNSDKYMRVQQAASTPVDRNEYSYELYYLDTIAPGISIQPDVQYVVNPGTDVVTGNATVLGLRLNVSL